MKLLPNLQTLSIDELWDFHAFVRSLLAEKLTVEKRKLEDRLNRLGADLTQSSSEVPRRQYPKVLAKYRNPNDPSQTWSGRGKTPRWIHEILEAGEDIEDLRIAETL
jgi:DNA-binding protein H-NS